MSVFIDKKFQNMDWLSQAIEPYEIELDEILCELPDRIDITEKYFHPIYDMSYAPSLNITQIIRKTLEQSDKFNVFKDSNYHRLILLEDSFKLICSDDATFDYSNKLITGQVALLKIRNSMPEEVAKEIISDDIRNSLYDLAHMTDISLEAIIDVTHILMDKNLSAFNEIINSTRLSKAKISAFTSALTKTLIDINRIKSQKAAQQLISIIRHYCTSKDPRYLGEILRVSKMMQNGQAIYSCLSPEEINA
jgi:hypothetical protein